MKINAKFSALICLIIFFVSIPSMAGAGSRRKRSAPAQKESGKIITVNAEGSAIVVKGRKAEARESARRELIRNALDIAVGSFVESVTKMDNYKIVSDKVFSQSKGLVRRISIKEEWIDESGMYHMTAECSVSETKLDLTLGPAVIDALGNPRIMIMLEQGTARSAVQKVFEKSGFAIINPSQAQILQDIDLEAARATGNYSAVRDAARNFRADVIIVGSAGSSLSSKQRILGQTLYAVASSVRLEAVLTDTAQTVGSEEFSWRPRRAAECSLSFGEGSARGLSSCASRAAESIVHKVAYALTGSGGAGALGGMTVKVIIRNIDFNSARALKNQLGIIHGVSGVYQRRYVNGSELELDIVSDKTADVIAGILADMNYEITDMSKSVVEGRKQ